MRHSHAFTSLLVLLASGCIDDPTLEPYESLEEPESSAVEGESAGALADMPDPQRDVCGPAPTWQPVESYDGTLGPSTSFVDEHERPVARLRFRLDLASRYDDPAGAAGNGTCTGTLVAPDLLLTSGHCFTHWPASPTHADGTPLTPEETALEMVAEFDHQASPGGTPRPVTTYAIESLEEHHLGSQSFAVVRLEDQPGLRWGYTNLARDLPGVGSTLTVIQQSSGGEVVEGGQYDGIDPIWEMVSYDDLDTTGLSLGAGVLDSKGEIIGVHYGGNCALGGYNSASRIDEILSLSDVLDDLVDGDVPLVGDLDGDGEDEMVIYRQATQRWYALRSDGTRIFPAGTEPLFGAPGDVPMLGDLDGDGEDEMIVWRPSSGKWYALRSDGTRVFPVGTEPAWGARGDVPLLGDLDGDDDDEMIAWRPSSGTWYALRTNKTRIFPAGSEPSWGTRGDVPLLGDLDDDGEDEMIVWRTSNYRWYALRRDGSRVFPAGAEPTWGARGDIPMVANLDSLWGDDMVIWRPSSGKWYALREDGSRVFPAGTEPSYGNDGDVPLPGNFDGLGHDDMGIWRPSNARWFAKSIWGATIFSNVAWGLPY